jgi:hypothetical protein
MRDFGPIKVHHGCKSSADDGSAEVAETTVKRLLCCGFRRTGKAMGQVYHSYITCFKFYINFWPIYRLFLSVKVMSNSWLKLYP